MGFVTLAIRRDAKGLGTEYTYFDAAGKPVRHRNGFLRMTVKYDDRGRPVENTFWGYDRSKGFARSVTRVDARGLDVEDAYFDADDRPVRTILGYTKVTRKYDAAGKPVENTYWGYDGSSGFARMVAKLNAKGQEVEYTYLDASGQATRHKGGYTRKLNIYDDRGMLVNARFFDAGPVAVKPMVMRVVPGGQAAKLGLKEGDIFLRYTGEETTSSARFIARRMSEKPADPPRRAGGPPRRAGADISGRIGIDRREPG